VGRRWRRLAGVVVGAEEEGGGGHGAVGGGEFGRGGAVQS
jgi:hypothetical protein